MRRSRGIRSRGFVGSGFSRIVEWRMTMTHSKALRRLAIAAAVVVLAVPLLSAATQVRIIQTNSAGDRVSLIDPATNKVVGEIKDIEANHGAVASPDGARIYISNEAMSTLDVADVKTLK